MEGFMIRGWDLILSRWRWLHELQTNQSALSQWGWGFHTVRDRIDMGDHRFRPRFVMHGRIFDPGMGPYPPRVALAYPGAMAGIIPIQYRPSRKSQ